MVAAVSASGGDRRTRRPAPGRLVDCGRARGRARPGPASSELAGNVERGRGGECDRRLGANAALDAELLKQGGVIAAYASDSDPEPRLPFWPLLFQNATLRLLGSDDFPPETKAEAALAINRVLEGGWPGPLVAERLPLDEIARAHEAVEGGGLTGRVVLAIGA
ncbi:MAG TPA: hypothetical protein VFS43_15630 [Polyangiaceae bacterium]|nr:hypothetical protein [Polyangiaceae bacterium]